MLIAGTTGSAANGLLSRKLSCWLSSTLIILANLAANLSYVLRLRACQSSVDWCAFILLDPLFVFLFLLFCVFVWHGADAASGEPSSKALKTATSYPLFAVSLTAFIASMWLDQLTTTTRPDGQYETPSVTTAFAIAALTFLMVIVLGKLLSLVAIIAKNQFRRRSQVD